MTTIYGVPLTYWPLDRTDNRPNAPFPEGRAEWITVHETDNWDDGADAEATARYLHNGSGGRQASWHDSVDDLEIWQTLRDHEQGWHAGDGYDGPGNTRSWGLEICVNFDGPKRIKAIHNAARRVAWLLDHGHGRRGVVQHNHWSGKHCPRGIREGHPLDWQAFLMLVGEYRGGDALTLEEEMTPEQIREIVDERTAVLQNRVDTLEARLARFNKVFVEYRFPKMQRAAALMSEAMVVDLPEDLE